MIDFEKNKFQTLCQRNDFEYYRLQFRH